MILDWIIAIGITVSWFAYLTVQMRKQDKMHKKDGENTETTE